MNLDRFRGNPDAFQLASRAFEKIRRNIAELRWSFHVKVVEPSRLRQRLGRPCGCSDSEAAERRAAEGKD